MTCHDCKYLLVRGDFAKRPHCHKRHKPHQETSPQIEEVLPNDTDTQLDDEEVLQQDTDSQQDGGDVPNQDIDSSGQDSNTSEQDTNIDTQSGVAVASMRMTKGRKRHVMDTISYDNCPPTDIVPLKERIALTPTNNRNMNNYVMLQNVRDEVRRLNAGVKREYFVCANPHFATRDMVTGKVRLSLAQINNRAGQCEYFVPKRGLRFDMAEYPRVDIALHKSEIAVSEGATEEEVELPILDDMTFYQDSEATATAVISLKKWTPVLYKWFIEGEAEVEAEQVGDDETGSNNTGEENDDGAGTDDNAGNSDSVSDTSTDIVDATDSETGATGDKEAGSPSVVDADSVDDSDNNTSVDESTGDTGANEEGVREEGSDGGTDSSSSAGQSELVGGEAVFTDTGERTNTIKLDTSKVGKKTYRVEVTNIDNTRIDRKQSTTAVEFTIEVVPVPVVEDEVTEDEGTTEGESGAESQENNEAEAATDSETEKYF